MRTSGARSRVLSGVALIAVAVGLGLFETQKSAGQSDKDFAVCGSAVQSRECQAQLRPMSVTWARSIAAGAQTLYEVDIQTGQHTTMFFTGLTRADVAPLEGLNAIEVRYRSGRPVAVIWPDGTPLAIPFALTHEFWMTILLVLMIGIVGGVFLLWGIVRAARGPRAPSYAY